MYGLLHLRPFRSLWIPQIPLPDNVAHSITLKFKLLFIQLFLPLN